MNILILFPSQEFPLHGIFFIPEKEDQRFIGLINVLSYYFLVMIFLGTSELRSELGLTILSFFTSVFLCALLKCGCLLLHVTSPMSPA